MEKLKKVGTYLYRIVFNELDAPYPCFLFIIITNKWFTSLPKAKKFFLARSAKIEHIVWKTKTKRFRLAFKNLSSIQNHQLLIKNKPCIINNLN